MEENILQKLLCLNGFMNVKCALNVIYIYIGIIIEIHFMIKKLMIICCFSCSKINFISLKLS